MLKIRRLRDRLIFNKGIPILVRRHLYIETAPWLPSQSDTCNGKYIAMSRRHYVATHICQDCSKGVHTISMVSEIFFIFSIYLHQSSPNQSTQQIATIFIYLERYCIFVQVDIRFLEYSIFKFIVIFLNTIMPVLDIVFTCVNTCRMGCTRYHVTRIPSSKMSLDIPVNPLWSSSAIWPNSSGSTLAPVMVCSLTAPRYSLNWYWLVFKDVPSQ